jgi:hypothetical protein
VCGCFAPTLPPENSHFSSLHHVDIDYTPCRRWCWNTQTSALLRKHAVLYAFIPPATKRRSDVPFTGCWITDHYQLERIALEYFWVWLAAFLNILIYIFLALVINGVVVLESGRIYLQRNCNRTNSHFTSVIGTQMLWYVVSLGLLSVIEHLYCYLTPSYPLVYIVTVYIRTTLLK